MFFACLGQHIHVADGIARTYILCTHGLDPTLYVTKYVYIQGLCKS